MSALEKAAYSGSWCLPLLRRRPPSSWRRRAAAPLLAALAGACFGACSGNSPAARLPRAPANTAMDVLIRGAIEESLAACERDEADALLELGLVYESNQMFDLAVRAYDLCLEYPERSPGARPAAVWFHRGRALAALGKSAAASASYSRSLELDGDYAPASWRKGSAQLEAGRIQEARASFEHAVALSPENVAARLGLARTLLLLDDPEGALATLMPVVARQADERFAHGLLARAYQALGDEPRFQAELSLEQSAKHVSMADPLTDDMRKRETGVLHALQRANRALAAGSPRSALRLMRPVYEREPNNLAALQMFARALLEDEQVERAASVLERGTRLHPEDFKLRLLLGLALQRLQRSAEALEHMQQARALNPTDTRALVALGELLAQLGRPAEAEERLREALAGQEPRVELATLLALGQVQQGLRAWARAVATFEHASRVAPDSPAVWALLAVTRHHAGDAQGARDALTRATELAPQSQRVRRARALLDGTGED